MPFPSTMDLSAIDGSNGFRINGASASDFSGLSVSAAGDVNGDGIDDIVIAAPGADPNGSYSGSSYVVFGRAGWSLPSVDPSSLDGSNGFRIDGASAKDRSGQSVSAAGDVNGDGIDDIIVGASWADPNGAYSGAGHVIFGQLSLPPPPDPPVSPPPAASDRNHAPLAGDDAFTLPWQTKLLVQGPGLLGNDRDADGNPLTVTGLVSGPAHGVLTWNADGGFVYQPNAAYVGPDGFTYQVSDGRGGFDTASVAITVADDERPDPVLPIDGGFGHERLSGTNQAETIRGNDGDDTIAGDGGRDRLEGNGGDDSILGEADEDIAWGGRGNDLVDGGHDMLSGDRGNDTLTGGEGADRFVFREGGGLDLVTDFSSAEGDRIVIDTGGDGILNGLSLGSFADLLARMVDTPDGVFLSLGDPDHGVTIAGITLDQLTAGDFLLL